MVKTNSNERANAYQRAWYAKNREKMRAYHRARRASRRNYFRQYEASHRAEATERMREWRSKNPGRTRAVKLRINYGLTIQQFDEMLQRQGGLCAICQRAFASNLPPHVDHDHATDRVRSLLCGSCNRAIGLLGEDPSRALSARAYLLRHRRDVGEAVA